MLRLSWFLFHISWKDVCLTGLQNVLVLGVWYLFDMQNIVVSPGTQGFPCCRTEKNKNLYSNLILQAISSEDFSLKFT